MLISHGLRSERPTRVLREGEPPRLHGAGLEIARLRVFLRCNRTVLFNEDSPRVTLVLAPWATSTLQLEQTDVVQDLARVTGKNK